MPGGDTRRVCARVIRLLCIGALSTSSRRGAVHTYECRAHCSFTVCGKVQQQPPSWRVQRSLIILSFHSVPYQRHQGKSGPSSPKPAGNCLCCLRAAAPSETPSWPRRLKFNGQRRSPVTQPPRVKSRLLRNPQHLPCPKIRHAHQLDRALGLRPLGAANFKFAALQRPDDDTLHQPRWTAAWKPPFDLSRGRDQELR